ncbi:MAG TPA: Sec-independent protein translocase protein TatB [Acidimicrobiales bacterium]|nr:Sec-independent protein translocase protein TatB [Acidimicrobiales bacterium]
MFNVGGGELLVIMLIALIVLGPQRLPDAAKQVGRVVGDLRRISSGFQQELKDALDTDDSPTPLRRKESAPLAATVADADRRAAPPTSRDTAAGTTTGAAAAIGTGTRSDASGASDDAGADGGATAPAAAVPGTGTHDQTTVAPAVAAALDEIVAPIDAPAVRPADAPPGERLTAGHAGSDAEQAGGAGGDVHGDQRAAS